MTRHNIVMENKGDKLVENKIPILRDQRGSSKFYCFSLKTRFLSLEKKQHIN